MLILRIANEYNTNLRPLKKSLRETSEASDEAILISKRDCFAPFSRSQ